MNSPMQTRTAGWTGPSRDIEGRGMEPPKTIERKRRGRNVDSVSILPTPPRTRQVVHLPTPETGHRHSKKVTKSTEKTMLPTPETVPRPSRKASSPRLADEDVTMLSPPSPSGHTTFFLINPSHSGRTERISRRRPGLTFAAQMGLIGQVATGSSGGPSNQAGTVRGAGIGIGGSKVGGVRKDQITWGKLADPIPLDRNQDENPFLVKSTLLSSPHSPDRNTLHLPRQRGPQHQEAESDVYMSPTRPLDARMKGLSSPPMFEIARVSAQPRSGLLSPPPTQRAPRIRTFEQLPSADEVQEKRAEDENSRRRREKMRQMLDIEENPFLEKPGESSRPRQALSPDFEERPTVTYVFRGSKKVFANPFYSASASFPSADLEPEHEDFEPLPNPKPKLLWPNGAEKKMDLKAFGSPGKSSSHRRSLTDPSGSLHTSSGRNKRPRSPSSSPPPSTPRRRLFTTEIRGGVNVGMGMDDSNDTVLHDAPAAGLAAASRDLFSSSAETRSGFGDDHVISDPHSRLEIPTRSEQGELRETKRVKAIRI